MPGFRPRRDPLLRLASSVGRRAAVGTGSVGVAGVLRAADVSGAGGGALNVAGELHQIDTFSITGTGTSAFTLTFDPVQDSWNPTLNGVMLEEGADYTISGDVLTVTSPTDLFKGVTTQGSPWQLRVQYDYLVGMPAVPITPATIGTTATGAGGNGTAAATFATPPAAGTSVVVAFETEGFEPADAMSGLGATWTKLAECSGNHHALWLGMGCDGASTTVTGGVTYSGNDARIAAVIVDGVTSTGVLSSTAELSGTTIGPLTAPGSGGIAFATGNVGTAGLPTTWTVIDSSGSTPFFTFAYVAVSPGASASQSTTGAHYAMALVPNA